MPTFDWSIGLRDVVAILALLFAGVALYGSLDKRVVVLEQAKEYQRLVDVAQDKRADELKSDLLNALRDVNGSVNRLADRVITAATVSRH